MKKIPIKDVDEFLYYEKLDNGLEVYMVTKKTVNNIYVTFNTKYGSIHNEFIPINGKDMIKVPNGIAHFLEHKMFEQEDGIDPMIFYASRGADVNAFTSLLNTAYLFYGPNHLKENLDFLLDYVGTPYFTDENVEKEKGIIEQEIVMYEDDPYSALDDGIRFNAFCEHPIRYSIPGTVEDINAITKEQLYDCYNTFYHPSNMFLVITGNFDPDEVMDVIKNNQKKKSYDDAQKIVIKDVDEPNEVFIEYEEKRMNVEVAKLALGVKIPLNGILLDEKKRNIYVSILFDILFGGTSLFFEKMKDNNYVETGIAIEKIHTNNHILVTINCDTNKEKELIKQIKDLLTSVLIEDDEFNRKKQLLLSSKIYLFENIKFLNNYILHNVVQYGNFDCDMIKVLKELNKKEFQDLIAKLDFSNTSTFVIKPLTKNSNLKEK